MEKLNVKELIGAIIFAVINGALSVVLTGLLGVYNITLVESATLINGTITYEVIIFFILSFIEALIYEKYQKKNKYSN